jgi:WD40 repeat protein
VETISQNQPLKQIPGESNNQPIEEEIPEPYQAYMDSDSEDSDSELSGREIDSDIEKEKEKSYDRPVYKEDLVILKPKVQEMMKKAESDTREKRKARPELSLNLKHVFGYRGYDCRDNIFCLQASGHIVYHVAALGIVHNKDTNIQSFYNEHTDDILCLCIHPNQKTIATGQIGRDPPIHVWDVDKLKTTSILKGEHYRGVCSMSFSSMFIVFLNKQQYNFYNHLLGDGKKLASIGLDDNHTLVVWDWKKGEKLATTR